MTFVRMGLTTLGLAAVIAAVSACNEKTAPPVVTKSALADSADQVMYGAHFNLTDKGLSRAELLSDTAFFFEDNTRIELRKVETTFYTASGARDAYLTSKRGSYNNRTGVMIARDDVIVITEEGRKLTTPELIYNQASNEISSDSAFVLTEPGRRLEGVGFRSDPNMQNVQILKTRSGSTGVVGLPNQ
ncbi:MAG TPA: LPS export ABC transporter periplasmic protein LptC [Gemmatimonadaceae bacterium]|nr:LPS export ABC transporter periplasmic protein LptC [Gemmatimonadaceae bacterium]